MATEIQIPEVKKGWSLLSTVMFGALVGVGFWIVMLLIRGVRRGWKFGGQPARYKDGGNRYGTPGAPAYAPTNQNPNGGAVTGTPSTGFSNLDEL
jgi:hypothetical protein